MLQISQTLLFALTLFSLYVFPSQATVSDACGVATSLLLLDPSLEERALLLAQDQVEVVDEVGRAHDSEFLHERREAAAVEQRPAPARARRWTPSRTAATRRG